MTDKILKKYKCKRCGATFYSALGKRCSKCKSPYHNVPRKKR